MAKNLLKQYENANWLVPLKLKKNLLLLSPYKPVADALCEWKTDYYGMFYTGSANRLQKLFRRYPKLVEKLTNRHNSLLRTMWSSEWSAAAADSFAYRLDGIYQSGYLRRSLRSRLAGAYASVAWEFLQRFFLMNEYSLSPSGFLQVYLESPDVSGGFFDEPAALLTALELDKGNPQVAGQVRAAVYENSGTVSYGIIRALFYSKQESSWKMAADLLLAAKLQEGLRQAVVEACSDGRVEAFRFIMRVIADNNLLRFASVVRAFDVWTGLLLESVRPDTVKRAFAIALDLLEHPEKQNEAVDGGNPLEVYLGLWAMANTEVYAAYRRIMELLDANAVPVPAQCAALAFLRITGCKLSFPEALKYLTMYKNDPAMTAYLLENLPDSGEMEENMPSGYPELRGLYFGFRELAAVLPRKTKKIRNPVFEWQELELSGERIWQILVEIATAAWNGELFEDLARSMPEMPTGGRHLVVDRVLEYLAPVPAEHKRGYGLRFAEDTLAEDAKRRRKMVPSPLLREALLAALSDKSMAIRDHALNILGRLKLSEEELIRVEDMLALKTASIRQAAITIIQAEKAEKRSAARLRASGNPEKIAAADELAPLEKKETVIDAAHGYGLFDAAAKWNPPEVKSDPAFHPSAILRDDPAHLLSAVKELNRLAEAHRGEEVECLGFDGSKYRQTFGEALRYAGYRNFRRDGFSSDKYLPEIWERFFAGHPMSTRELIHLFLLLLPAMDADVERLFFQTVRPDAGEKSSRIFFLGAVHRQLKKNPDFPAFVANMLLSIAADTPEKLWKIAVTKRYPWGREIIHATDGEAFSCLAELLREAPFSQEIFLARYALWRKSAGEDEKPFQNTVLSKEDLLKAYDAGFIPLTFVRHRLCFYLESRPSLHEAEQCGHPAVRKLIEDAVDLELTRGDLPTGLSRTLREIRKLEGTERFVRLLNALGSSPFVRGYIFGDEKPQVFSHLIKVSVPQSGETAETLRECLKPYRIPEKRLIEAAMYAPAWLEIIGEYLGIPGLPMAGWYFHAHVNELFSAEKETHVARYSAVTPQEFNDGAFDVEWFRQAYDAVGETMFARLYDAAKYISGGANHRRSQIFADAALGKLTEAEIEVNMASKRSKEYVMAYGILAGDDFLHRYENLVKFRKESRQFGGQRQASEKLAVEIGIGNLARTAGFSDVNRFLWRMESAKLAELKPLFTPRTVGEISLALFIDENGRAGLQVSKNGKLLKSLPASLRKEKPVLELQTAVKSLREQQSRARKSLETAMEREDVFEYAEVRGLMENPVLGPLAGKLLWQSGGQIGFFDELSEKELKIAHPADLLKSGKWSDFQRMVLEKQIQQPFKQVFRELYTLNADEKLDGVKSERYAGNQVMPKKAAALLRTRGWTVDMETGLQKVFHKRNLIAKIYALADWFSPSDIEPPTLEYVQFEHRRTGMPVPFGEIPEVLFSEVMRDLDLMVSTAHAGGVDPEATHSTVEMRAALVTAMLPLFRLNNVKIEKSHAFICGKFGEYTVHLGSGVCHKQARGMVNILPVHSQTRGRIFLPFADDDPKTAEVVAKILFLAEDTKIRDPNILDQIR